MEEETTFEGGAVASRARRLLVVNPNGNTKVNDLLRSAAARVLGPASTVHVVNPPHSPHSIETLEDRRRAEPLALELLSQHRDYDAYVMACFDDIAVDAGRRLLGAPVVGAAEAAIVAACLFTCRFAIVTTVEGMVSGIRALIENLGVSRRCTVRAAGVGVAAAAGFCGSVDARLDDAIVAARNVDGAGAVILGSGGLSGRAAALSRRHGIPVVDAIESAILMADAAALMAAPTRR